MITNNPNDQLRVEDLENEAATGRKPSYLETSEGEWISYKQCYEGDGDLIEGDTEPTEIPAGTFFKIKLPLQSTFPAGKGHETLAEDLRKGFTNAWYTSIDRDPFEWSYRKTDLGSNAHVFQGLDAPISDDEAATRNLELVSGPRWRLKASKFGRKSNALQCALSRSINASHLLLRHFEIRGHPKSRYPAFGMFEATL